MLVRTALAAVALATLPALAAEGFFRHQESLAHEAPDFGARDGAPAMVCALVIRYDNARPAAQEITFEGPQDVCTGPGYRGAVAWAILANAAPKSTGGNDPLRDGPPYECAMVLNFAPGLPTAPAITYLGLSTCAATRSAALAATQQAIACVSHGPQICPPALPLPPQ